MSEPEEAHEKIIAGGESDWWRSAEGVETRRRIEEEVRARYENKLARAAWPGRALLELRIRREIARECARVTLEILWAKEAGSDGP